MIYIEVPRLNFQAREIHAGRFPLWDPHIWAGQPLIGQTQPGPLYPLNLLLYLLPLKDGYLKAAYLNGYYVVIHFLAALFCYLFARDLGRSQAAGVIGACVFAFGGFIGSVAWLDVVNGAIWTPLVFLFLFRAARGQTPERSAALGGLCLGAAWLCGHHEIPMMVSYLAGATWLFHVWKDRKLIRPAALFFLVMFLISAVQTIPTYEFGRISHRWVGLDSPIGWNDTVPYVAHGVYSMPAHGILGLFVHGVNAADSSPFLGMIAMALAALGVAASWGNRNVRWLTLVGAGATVYALGAATPFHGVLYAIAPLLGKARIPVRAIHLTGFAVAVLAAYGVDAVFEGSVWVRRIAITLAAVAGAVALTIIMLRNAPDEALVLSAILGAVFGLLVVKRDALTRRALVGSVAALLLIELAGLQNFPNIYQKNKNIFIRKLTQEADIVSFIRSQKGPVRVAVNDTDIPMNFGDWHGIDMLQGYMAGVSDNVFRLELHTERTQKLFAVTHSIGKKPDFPNWPEAFAGVSGVKVWRNPDPMPRAWAVHETIGVTSDAELRRLIQDPGTDLSRKAILLGPAPPLKSCGGSDQVRID
ncbi:MAG: hypothetical protein EXQ52_18600, partial [Bryobacterales bacterium]|nr:hypothetical protein [Bryobacterales bacterium]